MTPSRFDTSSDTIAAVATPPGRGAIVLIRMSGSGTRAILDQVFRPAGPRHRLVSHRVCLGRIVVPGDAESIDQVCVTFLGQPRTYTGQDMGEISCHGSPVLARDILAVLLGQGARLAMPGEFTQRAFLAGKLDLTQAEAIRDLVDSRTSFQARLARRQVDGSVSRSVRPVTEQLTDMIVRLETMVEFPDEAIDPEPPGQLPGLLEEMVSRLATIEKGFTLGRLVRDGFSLVITGRPNVGKSSLFNLLLGQDRAIVTEMPGTTRDLLREQANLNGIPITFMDTAGIRSAADKAERMGIDRSFSAIAEADVVLHVVDASGEWTAGEEDRLRDLPPHGLIVVLNKIDLPVRIQPEWLRDKCPASPVVAISALTGQGLESLRDTIVKVVLPGGAAGGIEGQLVSNIRQQECITAAREELQAALQTGRRGLTEEYVLFHLRRGLDHLGEVTGEITAEDILTKIFTTFCIGK